VALTGEITGHRRPVIGLGDRLSYLQALALELLPGKLMTRDNYDSMKVDNVCSAPFPVRHRACRHRGSRSLLSRRRRPARALPHLPRSRAQSDRALNAHGLHAGHRQQGVFIVVDAAVARDAAHRHRFREVRIPLYEGGYSERIAKYSVAGKVPILVDGDLTVWESLAICEYLAERHPERQLWPADASARAHARAISAEMHAGFQPLRSNMTMNVRRTFPGVGMTPDVESDIARIDAIWSECMQRYGGPFLYGGFTIADAMYAPVATPLRDLRCLLVRAGPQVCG
jgi:glutathione S-transferase